MLPRLDIQDHIKTPEDQVRYLEAALEDGDPEGTAIALGDIAKARGVTNIAKEAGLSRETIYKAFKPGGNPTLETLTKTVKVLGLRLTAVAA
ncbi:addiction module antidote protein [Chelatococcus reniformis]|uniref:Transcriptional regulator n=1 Tax=Chelatococcus reniformis TaxID=1494448 RepID=A0A916XEF6_9HYPH|nr:addiction module antidote protein [Chelatococcus reniformis]GGC67933.1 transcriptional regulator [Chelatococcus reniformis]